jgi:NodT family efflux transporter outer membrane factor (OMF) lipoprotein
MKVEIPGHAPVRNRLRRRAFDQDDGRKREKALLLLNSCEMPLRLSLLLLVAVMPLFGTSCKVGPAYSTPTAKVSTQWTVDSVGTNAAHRIGDSYWWHALEDPVLDELVGTARSNNLSVQAAGVRILEARAHLNQSIGKLFPQQQGLSGGVNYARLNDGLASTIPGVHPNYISDQILFAATWEIDFWGKYRRGIESDQAAYFGSIAGYEDVLVTMTADVAATYVTYRTTEERLQVARQNVEIQRESLRIAAAQFRAGETSERDVQQATTQLAQTEAQIPLLEQALSQTRNGMMVLLGETAEEVQRRLTVPGKIPQVPTTIAVGIPHDLLRRRPDIRAAGFAAASKCALIGVARANMYPAFSLTGEFGFGGNNQANNSLVDMFTWQGRALSAGANFLFPVFNYGRLLNQVRVQDAQFQEAILSYQNTVLAAQQEVENGLAAFAGQQRSVAEFAKAASAARRSVQLAMVQYKSGQTDYTTVLTAEQAQLSIEDALANTRGNVVLGLVSVYRALGGGWELGEGKDVVSAEIKAEMARRTDWGKLLEPSHHLPMEKADGRGLLGPTE